MTSGGPYLTGQRFICESGILEYCHKSDTFQDVGGLRNLLGWFNARLPVFAGTARYAGLEKPKGVLLVGCGRLRQEP